MTIKRANDLLMAHEVPLEEIYIGPNSITVEFDDINEKRRKIFFCPFQAFRITTIDCADQDIVYGEYTRSLSECVDSPWIDDLRSQLIDSEDDFLKNSKHYMLLLGDNFLEIVAWSADIS